MFEPAIGDFAPFGRLFGPLLDSLEAVVGRFGIFFKSRHRRLEVGDSFVERLLSLGVGDRVLLRFEEACGRLGDGRADLLRLIEIEQIRGFDVVFRRPVLGVLGAGFGKRQQQGENGDDERHRLAFLFRLDRGFGGFRHGLPLLKFGRA